MSGTDPRWQQAGTVRSQVGGCILGSHAVFRGKNLHEDLKSIDWLALHLFGITGRQFAPEQLRVLHAIWVCTSYPDARIWNNRIAALAGSSRSTPVLGVAAAVAVSEAGIYGIGPCLGAYDFFSEALRRTQNGEDLERVVVDCLRRERSIGGYGRPLVAADERLAPLMEIVRECGLQDGPHLRLAWDVDRILGEGRWRQRMNYAALATALPLDLGFTRPQFHAYMTHVFLAGMTPCHLDAADQPAGSFLPLSIAHIHYEGRAPREWTRNSHDSD